MKFKTALFDFDGVIVDTEPIYDIFWNEAGERYGTGIDNFAAVIKGTTLPTSWKSIFPTVRKNSAGWLLMNRPNTKARCPCPPCPAPWNFCTY